MRSVGSFEAKTHLAELLASVERGEEIVITRRGTPVARLLPMEKVSERASALEKLEALRRKLRGRVTQADILDARNTGRR